MASTNNARVLAPLTGTRADHPDAGDPENRLQRVVVDTVIAYDPSSEIWLVEDDCGHYFEIRAAQTGALDDFNLPAWELMQKVECSHDDYTSGAGLARWLNA